MTTRFPSTRRTPRRSPRGLRTLLTVLAMAVLAPSATALADAMAVVPDGDGLPAGSEVDVLLLA